MNRTFVMLLMLLMIGNQVWGQTLGDIDGDGKVDLKEATYALQVSSGLRSPMSVTAYDRYEYGAPSGSNYLYRTVEGESTYNTYVETFDTTFEGHSVKAHQWKSGLWAGIIDYIRVGEEESELMGYWWRDTLFSYSEPRLSPRYILPGERYIHVYSETPGGRQYIREYEFIGVEDVEVPAGTFTQCIKILQRREGGVYRLSYLAKGVGMVKYISADGHTGFMFELVRAEIGDIIYPEGAGLCTIEGTWKLEGTDEEGPLAVHYNPDSLPVHVMLTLSSSSYHRRDYLISSDGVTFTADTDAYSNQSYSQQPPEIEISIEGSSVTGHIQTFWNNQPHDRLLIEGTKVCK